MTVTSAKAKLKAHFREHQGEVINGKDLAQLVSPVVEWARRVRELREQEGWLIFTNNDTQDLKPGEYMLVADPPEKPNIAFVRGISQKLRAEVLDRDGSTCQMCGKTAGETDPDTGRPVRLHLGHIQDKIYGGKDELSNLRTLCSTCNQGAKNITSEKPSLIWLLAQVRRAGLDDQQAVYEWLKSKYKD